MDPLLISKIMAKGANLKNEEGYYIWNI